MNRIRQALKEDFHKKDFSKLLFLTLTNFSLMLSYSLIRPTSSSIFLQNVGAKNTPIAWFFSIIILIITIFGFNKLHFKLDVHKRYLVFATTSAAAIVVTFLLIPLAPTLLSYVLYILKEIYVVVLFNLFISYANNIFSLTSKKTFYGIIGALGSLGGFLGGHALSTYIKEISIQGGVIFSATFIVLSAVSFYFSSGLKERAEVHKNEKKISPLKAVRNIREYVFLIALVIMLMQFVINIADFKFNQFVAQVVTTENKTALFANVYKYINLFALASQLLLMPLILNLTSNRTIQLSIPTIYLATTFLTFALGSNILIAAGVFILFKGIDYSFFSTSKEILYHKLNSVQQYGAKYITDMVCYRLGKAIIAVFLIFVQDVKILNALIVIFLIAWLISVVKLFKIQSKMEA